MPFAGHSLVLVRRHPRNVGQGDRLAEFDLPAAFDGLARKLPHYGKYSYLAFNGEEPTNIVKGQWSADTSPLVVDLRENRTGDVAATADRKTHRARRIASGFLGAKPGETCAMAVRARAGRTRAGQCGPATIRRVHREADGRRRPATGWRERNLVPEIHRRPRVPTESRSKR